MGDHVPAGAAVSPRGHTSQLRLGAWVERELVVDLFAGGGGASEGIARALGRHPDIAVNHDPAAIAMHAANHPTTVHYCESVFRVTPREVVGGRPVGLLWASPDCTHFSKSKGGKPRKKKIRGLAWVVVRWARDVAPRVIALENVEEFADWGPLGPDDRPDKARAGQTFRAFVRKLERYGYRVEHRILVAADYGAPTTRKRLFLVARRDGQPITWPEPTHARSGRGPRAWRTAAEVIDWSIPCPSIFERARPLADATLRRIAAGVRRYVIDAARPFIVPVTHPRDARVHSIDEPVRTVTAANRGELALIAPTLVQTGYGERDGQAPRVPGLDKPLGTVVAGAAKHALVAAFVTKHYGGVVGHELGRALGTVTTQDHHSLSVAHLEKFYGTAAGADVREPMPTITAGGQHIAAVRTLLARYEAGADPLLSIDGEAFAIVDIGMRMLVPRELFRAQGFGDHYIIDPVVDRPLRNGGVLRLPMTKTEQIAKAGNSVCPPLAEAIVRANVRGRVEVAA
ncbi:C-5 cytosine-specific DNA methylase [Sandaracinus amylolyticus]|uniref:DNA (cytosine-5-)-methyltransferase n=1 Tax=Sandaracinus amylolyticus TaxID=927083 RepID=A0A0F6W2V5_9BACT|nr:C-5 cytosine-specific DNA methylase [Sandaracinus amylolyticus]